MLIRFFDAKLGTHKYCLYRGTILQKGSALAPLEHLTTGRNSVLLVACQQSCSVVLSGTSAQKRSKQLAHKQAPGTGHEPS